MQTNTLLIILFLILIGQYLFNTILTVLNNKNRDAAIPEGLNDIYELQEYQKSQNYGKENATFSLFSSTISLIVTLLFLAMGIFGKLDLWVGTYTTHPVVQPLLFFGILGLGSLILQLPISYYHTFVIEEKYNFNRSTIKTFLLDQVKSILLGGILGGGILALIILAYLSLGSTFFIAAFAIVAGFSLFMLLFYSSLIVPLFNKQTPLEEGDLKNKILDFAKEVNFPIKEIYVMDGSKRSSKANAYFTGLGKTKRIVLFDTLIEQLTEDEIVAVLAHEVGHAKKQHVIQSMVFSFAQQLMMFYLLSLVIEYPISSKVLGSDTHTFELGLLFFSFIFSPFSEITSIALSIFSRKNEYEADTFAKEYQLKEPLISGLKKISKNALVNLTPHPLVVKCTYSHPTLLQRITNLNK